MEVAGLERTVIGVKAGTIRSAVRKLPLSISFRCLRNSTPMRLQLLVGPLAKRLGR